MKFPSPLTEPRSFPQLSVLSTSDRRNSELKFRTKMLHWARQSTANNGETWWHRTYSQRIQKKEPKTTGSSWRCFHLFLMTCKKKYTRFQSVFRVCGPHHLGLSVPMKKNETASAQSFPSLIRTTQFRCQNRRNNHRKEEETSTETAELQAT